MKGNLQTWLALGIVAVTVAWLIWRAVRRRRPGAGGSCGCAGDGCGVAKAKGKLTQRE